jgi:hypothetical protein
MKRGPGTVAGGGPGARGDMNEDGLDDVLACKLPSLSSVGKLHVRDMAPCPMRVSSVIETRRLVNVTVHSSVAFRNSNFFLLLTIFYDLLFIIAPD